MGAKENKEVILKIKNISTMKKEYDVFISYSRRDYVDENMNPIEGNVISMIMEFLDKHGITYWIDKDGVYSGSKFDTLITDAITDSKMMIFVSSIHSNTSTWTAGELIEALNQGKLIVPFRIDDSQYNKTYRLRLNALDYIEYKKNPIVAFEELLKSITNYKAEYENSIRLQEQERLRREQQNREKEQQEELIRGIMVDLKSLSTSDSALEKQRMAIRKRIALVIDDTTKKELTLMLEQSNTAYFNESVQRKSLVESLNRTEKEKEDLAKDNAALRLSLKQEMSEKEELAKSIFKVQGKMADEKPIRKFFRKYWIHGVIYSFMVVLLVQISNEWTQSVNKAEWAMKDVRERVSAIVIEDHIMSYSFNDAMRPTHGTFEYNYSIPYNEGDTLIVDIDLNIGEPNFHDYSSMYERNEWKYYWRTGYTTINVGLFSFDSRTDTIYDNCIKHVFSGHGTTRLDWVFHPTDSVEAQKNDYINIKVRRCTQKKKILNTINRYLEQ